MTAPTNGSHKGAVGRQYPSRTEFHALSAREQPSAHHELSGEIDMPTPGWVDSSAGKPVIAGVMFAGGAAVLGLGYLAAKGLAWLWTVLA